MLPAAIFQPPCPSKIESTSAAQAMDNTAILRVHADDLDECQTPTPNLPNDAHATPLDKSTDSTGAARLAEHQNWQLSPIYRLPNEILGHVFEFVYYLASIDHELWNSGFEATGEYGRYLVGSISLVSRRWKEIVLLNPRLWSIIDYPTCPAVKACIPRSKNVPLRIRLFAGHYNFTKARKTETLEKFIPILATCIDRWQSLSHDETQMTILDLFFAHPAPNLEMLQLDAGYGPESEERSMFPTTLHIPDGFFNGKLPRLRKLRLLSCHLPLNPSNYANLIELSLSMIEFYDSSMFALFGVFVACPSLELLRLHYLYFLPSLSEAESHALANMTPIAMSQLQELSIAYIINPDFAQIILGSIHPPRSLHLRVVNDTQAVADLRDLLPLHTDVQSTLQSLLDIEELAFTFRLDTFHDVNVPMSAWHIRAVSRGALPDRLPCPLMSLRLFPIDFGPESTEGLELESRLFLNIGRDLRLPLLRVLKIAHLDRVILGAAAFADVLAHLPSIQHLEFVSCSPIFVRTLTFTPNQRLCLSLEVLQLEHLFIAGEDLLTLVESRAWVTDGGQKGTAPVRLRLVLADCSAMDQLSVLQLVEEYAEVIINP